MFRVSRTTHKHPTLSPSNARLSTWAARQKSPNRMAALVFLKAKIQTKPCLVSDVRPTVWLQFKIHSTLWFSLKSNNIEQEETRAFSLLSILVAQIQGRKSWGGGVVWWELPALWLPAAGLSAGTSWGRAALVLPCVPCCQLAAIEVCGAPHITPRGAPPRS